MAAIELAGDDPRLVAAGEALEADDLETSKNLLGQALRQAPDDVAALRMLGEIAARGGFLSEAEQLLRRALELAPAFVYARIHLARVLHSQNRPAEALSELDIVRAAEGDHDDTLMLRASILSRVGDYDEAIALYTQLLARSPDVLEMWTSLAHLQKTVGQQEQAVESCRRAIEIAPGYGDAWWSLANLKNHRFSDTEVAAMEAAIETPALGDDDRLQLLFALGKAREERGDYAASFERYAQANEIRASQLPYDPLATETFVEESIKLFTREFFEQRSKLGHPAPAPSFILGMPRSGSTLVEQILASHPAVEGTAELPDIIVLARRLEDAGGPSRNEGWRNYPALVADLSADELNALGKLYLDRTRIQRKTDRPFFIDKMPNNWVHVGLIHSILPNARIIDTRRHPLACGFSNFKQHFARGQEFSYGLDRFGHYYQSYVRLMRSFDEAAPGAVYRLIHERLVDDPTTEITRLLEAAGLPFDDACLRFFESKRPVRTASAEQVRRPIDKDAVDQWRPFEQYLDPLKTALGDALDNWDR
jgi:tetratricopeptide (TPR) repeat protein